MKSLNNYFSFNRGEKRGVFILFIIIFLLIISIQFIDIFNIKESTDFTQFENAINQFEKERNLDLINKKVEFFQFDPNIISSEQWTSLGFKDWQINIINNFKSKGGKWKTKEEFSKLYGLDSSQFINLKPYLLLPDTIEDNNENITTNISSEKKILYFNFNPNLISDKEWVKLGFTDWQVKSINKYKSKGGSWKVKSDVKKIYGLSEDNYIKLEPYILLPDIVKKKTTKKEFNSLVDINKADSKEMTKLKGINSEKYANIIVKYRESLGGFTNKEQLKEVWNLTEETYNGFEHQIIVNKSNIKKININTDNIKDLTKHPYIDWKTANSIIKYKKANGDFTKIEDIKKIHTINSNTFEKISPYLDIK